MSIQIQNLFEREYNGMTFRDAIYFTPEEYAALTPQQITAMEDERFANWVSVITAPPDPNQQPTETPEPPNRILTKLEFRQRFTFTEQVLIDNYDGPNKEQVKTLLANFSVADNIDLDLDITEFGVNLMDQLGLIAPGRAAEILR